MEKEFKLSENSRSPGLLQYLKEIQQKNIKKCVFLGLGNFASVGGDLVPGTQFNSFIADMVILRVLIEGLKRETTTLGKTRIPVFIQDAGFTIGEKSYLKHFGYDLVKDIEDKVEMSARTLLYAPYIDRIIVTRAIKNKVQVMCTSNNVEEVIENASTREQGNVVPGRYQHVRILELFKEVDSETQQQPVFGEGQLEQERYTTVYWVDPNHWEPEGVSTTTEEMK